MAEKKPIDRWLTLVGLVVGIMLYLVPKTPLVVICGLVLIFILLIHPIWHFWWIEKSIWRRLGVLTFLLGILIFIGFISWPTQPSIQDKNVIDQSIIKQLQATGNLKQRAINLSNNIMEDESIKERMKENIDEPYEEQRKRYYSLSQFFEWKYFREVKDIRNEFAQLHHKDSKLEYFIKIQDSNQNRNKQLSDEERKEFIDISPMDIIEVANSLKALADQLK